MTTPNDASTASPAAPRNDPTVRFVVLATAACAVALAGATWHLWNLRFGVGTLVGGAIAVANFVVLARIGRALTGSQGGAGFWGMVYLFKLLALFGGLALLMRSGALYPLSPVIGFAAIVPGIVVGGVLAASRSDPPGA